MSGSVERWVVVASSLGIIVVVEICKFGASLTSCGRWLAKFRHYYMVGTLRFREQFAEMEDMGRDDNDRNHAWK